MVISREPVRHESAKEFVPPVGQIVFKDASFFMQIDHSYVILLRVVIAISLAHGRHVVQTLAHIHRASEVLRQSINIGVVSQQDLASRLQQMERQD
jgi:hypothetical protein